MISQSIPPQLCAYACSTGQAGRNYAANSGFNGNRGVSAIINCAVDATINCSNWLGTGVEGWYIGNQELGRFRCCGMEERKPGGVWDKRVSMGQRIKQKERVDLECKTGWTVLRDGKTETGWNVGLH